MLVSSANKILLTNVDTSYRTNFDTSHMSSYMYKIISIDPRIDPCGTPHLIFISYGLLLS